MASRPVVSTPPTTAPPSACVCNIAASSVVPLEVPIISTSTTSGVLTSAHRFTIGQLTAFSQNIHSGVTVLHHLSDKAAPIATHGSSARAYPPRCHPDTRKHLRNDVVQWGMGDGSNGRMFWLLGPAAVGKSAVAQTISEEFGETGRLGASFFFSRPNQIDDPDWVIPTLALQLATKHAQYKHILTQYFADNPLILTKNRRTQFRELIIEPFRILMAKYPHTIRGPLLIILDGLDECKDKQAQCELIDLISTHVREVKEFPLQWMICSRPEWYLKSTLSDADFHGVCERKEVEVDDPEARGDVKRLLEAGVDKIRKRYKDRLPDGWPPEHHLWDITSVASGRLGFASFVLRFIEDEEYDDPDGQLQV
ncbi:hypothetical protein P691DRAFT_765028 [Macrolepiota fuliginosa MF-IS2]|uniref:Nephrocystin 3-like N-terminal domain-containing protein n=1 Tax=Macrolepiota fuliginosa MF-IS2 TaxID=1400762 RepID=A0A9P6BYN3_9AGAR|nr:hypothetical protein P691DRAFT_765028 [Macrolepiota fuliginosa MF-IS2]